MAESQQIIKVLDDITVNKIAAGEVVERPASVVKELVENSLDAGATEIRIDLSEGGRKSIVVTDNGIGMCREDALLCLQRHATSKITSDEDLFSITTLGFRGEALPSIASVSRLEMTTRQETAESGVRVVCAGGTIEDVAEVGAPVGTSVSVRELFYNVPARRKFLKTAQTELGHAVDLANRFALSHPGVNLTLEHDGRVVLKTHGLDKLEDSVLTVFGRDAVKAVVPVFGEAGGYRVHGFVSRPGYSKPNRSGQMFYVNHRFVRSRNLYHALDEAYRGILGQGRFPLFIGFIELDPQLVDVNVHPTKSEVKFVKEWEVHNLVATAVRNALASSAVAPDGLDSLPRAAPRPAAHPADTPKLDLQPFRDALLARRRETEAARGIEPPPVEPASLVRTEERMDTPKPAETEADVLADLTVVAQVLNMYIVAQGPRGLVLIDQHAAHERILYHRLGSSSGQAQVQRLVVPVTMSLAHRQMLVVQSKLEDLHALGFEIEAFGKDTIVVRAVPALLALKDCEPILRDTIEELTELTVTRRLVVRTEAVLMTTACKMAVKAGEKLTTDEMQRLIADLRRTDNPYLCPHGRPTAVQITSRELEKMFGRI